MDQVLPPSGNASSQGSRTAQISAFSRARHRLRSRPPFIIDDPYAKHFVTERLWRSILASELLDLILRKTVMRRVLPVTTQNLTRARYSEDRVDTAHEQGTTQYIILGSGYDTYALRHPTTSLRIYEIDTPDTIEIKRRRIAEKGWKLPAGHRWVPMDLETDKLGRRLEVSGFDQHERTIITAMGLTYYLTRGAVIELLEELAEVVSQGSEIVFDYLIAAHCVPHKDRGLFRDMMRIVERRGEPMISRFDPEEMPALLGKKDQWEIVGNESPEIHQERYVGARADVPPIAPITWSLHLKRKAVGRH